MKYTTVVKFYVGDQHRTVSESFSTHVDALVYANNKVNAIIELGMIDQFTVFIEGERGE